jgi:hypothetical protein
MRFVPLLARIFEHDLIQLASLFLKTCSIRGFTGMFLLWNPRMLAGIGSTVAVTHPIKDALKRFPRADAERGKA